MYMLLSEEDLGQFGNTQCEQRTKKGCIILSETEAISTLLTIGINYDTLFLQKYNYRSLSKKGPWAVHLTLGSNWGWADIQATIKSG